MTGNLSEQLRKVKDCCRISLQQTRGVRIYRKMGGNWMGPQFSLTKPTINSRPFLPDVYNLHLVKRCLKNTARLVCRTDREDLFAAAPFVQSILIVESDVSTHESQAGQWRSKIHSPNCLSPSEVSSLVVLRGIFEEDYANYSPPVNNSLRITFHAWNLEQPFCKAGSFQGEAQSCLRGDIYESQMDGIARGQGGAFNLIDFQIGLCDDH